MCSRYNLTSPHEAVRAYFGYMNDEPFPPRYNIAPTQPVAIVRMGHAGKRELQVVRWGLVPGWVKDPRTFSTLINARAETAAEKPSFRGGMRHRRCLVPADGFYEWSGPKGRRQAYHVHRSAGGPFAMAGIADHWLGPDGSEFESMAILTVPANGPVGAIHDRMPAILAPDTFDIWLDCKNERAEVVARLLKPAPDEWLSVTPIGPRINNPTVDGPDLLHPENGA